MPFGIAAAIAASVIINRATAFSRRGPGELLPVHRGGEVAAAQRQAGELADEGLPCRLLRSAQGPALSSALMIGRIGI